MQMDLTSDICWQLRRQGYVQTVQTRLRSADRHSDSPRYPLQDSSSQHHDMMRPSDHVSLLILGAGWTSTFLIPLLKERSVSFAATTTTGRDDTIKFQFDPESSDLEPYRLLPHADTILITFPLKGKGPSKTITDLYAQTHHGGDSARWIQLGSTGIYATAQWIDHKSPYDTSNERAIAEEELLGIGGAVLNLGGLYGGNREPENWVSRVAKTKDQLKAKRSLHMIHGEDVSRAVIAVHKSWAKAQGKRWLLTDLHVYDWWDLIWAWSAPEEQLIQNKDTETAPYRRWIMELMQEEDVKALPRGPETLGRVLDSRAFWQTMGLSPSVGRIQ